MRNMMRSMLGAGAMLAFALSAQAAQVSGTPALRDCSNVVLNDAESGELYAVKIPSTLGANFSEDFLWDLEQKAESAIGNASLTSSSGFAVDDSWNVPQLPSDIHLIYVTYPRTGAGTGDRLVVDSGTAGEFLFGASTIQTIGNSIPTGMDASVGLTIPGNSTQYLVDFDGSANDRVVDAARPAQFPAATPSGAVIIAFAPIADISEFSPVGDPLSCTIGGKNANPNDPAATNPTPTIGGIIGYNVYRIPSTGANTGSPAEFMTGITDADPNTGYVGFADLRTFRFQVSDTTNRGPAGSELNAISDIVGLQNRDGRMYSGDEVVIFQDGLRDLAGNPRANAPDRTQDYWYAVQPVIQGRVSDFANVVGFTNNSLMAGNHTIDIDNDGTADSVSLDTLAPHNTPEFISPQADVGLDGLGLTVDGRVLLSAPMHFDNASPLPAGGQVRLSGSVSGNDVSLQFTTGLEAGTVQEYNVFRVVNGTNVPVNTTPISAQRAESNVYQLVDDATQARRLARGGSVQYMVQIVYSDGTPSAMVGPFDVAMGSAQPVRRRR